MSCRCLNRGVRVSPSVLGTPISYMVSESTYTGLLDLFQLSSWISWETCHSCDFENLQKRTRNGSPHQMRHVTLLVTHTRPRWFGQNMCPFYATWVTYITARVRLSLTSKHARKQMQRVPCQAQRQDILCVCQSSLWHVSLQYTAE